MLKLLIDGGVNEARAYRSTQNCCMPKALCEAHCQWYGFEQLSFTTQQSLSNIVGQKKVHKSAESLDRIIDSIPPAPVPRPPARVPGQQAAPVPRPLPPVPRPLPPVPRPLPPVPGQQPASVPDRPASTYGTVVEEFKAITQNGGVKLNRVPEHARSEHQVNRGIGGVLLRRSDDMCGNDDAVKQRLAREQELYESAVKNGDCVSPEEWNDDE